MTPLETLGVMFLTFIAFPVAVTIINSVKNYINDFRRRRCFACHGNGGHDNPLLIFSRHSWEECRKCNGTGER